MRKILGPAALFALSIGMPALAQTAPRYEEPPEYQGMSDEVREAYRRGYEQGFEKGYARGFSEGRKQGVDAPAPPPAPRLGPIAISAAIYGTSSHNCDATRFVRRRAEGRASYSIEVSNEICGDPAHGDRKSLDVTYYCGDVRKTASAFEHRTLYLDCTN